MNRKYVLPCVACLAAAMLSSCLGTNDSDVTYYSDTAITSFTLGSLNKIEKTKSANTGNDTTIVSTVTGSLYNIAIDQIGCKIFNRDSLPMFTDLTHVPVTISTRNSGVVVVKNIGDDQYTYFNSKDSLDLSVERIIGVVSTDGNFKRDYTVSLTAKNTAAQTQLTWGNAICNSEEIASLSGFKAVAAGDNMLLFGDRGGAGVVYSSPISDGTVWTMLTPNINTPLAPDLYQSIVVKGDYVYALMQGTLLRTADGASWEQLATSLPLAKLVAAGTEELFALGTDMRLKRSVDNGSTWTDEHLDEDDSYQGNAKDLLPTEHTAYVCMPTDVAKATDHILLAGTAAALPDDGVARVWRKVSEYGSSQAGQWVYVTPDFETNHYMLPRQESLSMVAYNGTLLALGSSGRLLQSRDQGITWLSTSAYQLPEGFDSSTTTTALTVDKEQNLWLIDSNGNVWRTRYVKD